MEFFEAPIHTQEDEAFATYEFRLRTIRVTYTGSLLRSRFNKVRLLHKTSMAYRNRVRWGRNVKNRGWKTFHSRQLEKVTNNEPFHLRYSESFPLFPMEGLSVQNKAIHRRPLKRAVKNGFVPFDAFVMSHARQSHKLIVLVDTYKCNF